MNKIYMKMKRRNMKTKMKKYNINIIIYCNFILFFEII